MPLMHSPNSVFRPEDKALKMLFPSTDEEHLDSFEEFFDKELYALDDSNDDGDSPDNDFSFIECTTNPPPTNLPTIQNETIPQPWRKGLWCLNPRSATGLVVQKTRKVGRMAQNFISPTHLANNDNFATRTPTSPSKMSTKTVLTMPKPAKVDVDKNLAYPVVDGQILSPSPNYAHLPLSGNMQCSETWQQDFQNFHLQMPDNGLYLMPHNDKTIQDQFALQQINAQVLTRNATAGGSSQSPTKFHRPFNHVSRADKLSPTRPIDAASQTHQTDLSHIRTEQLQYQTYSTADLDDCSAPVWTTESLHSSDESQSSKYSNQSYPPVYPSFVDTAWASSQLDMEMKYLDYEEQSDIVAPIPQRAPHQVLCQEHESDALGIHYNIEDGIGRAIPYEHTHGYTTEHRGRAPAHTQHAVATPYPPLPPYPPGEQIDACLFTTLRKPRPSCSRSPSPTISPTRRSVSRGPGQRSPTRSEHSQSRRKSIHKPGPIKDTSRHDPNRTNRSSSRPPRTPKTPKTPTSASFGQVDFVNFTPKDSAKLMADVAPSGSSKTRARREQEAREKRKRLSEAAFQAVRNAGGDVRALEKAIFV